MTDIDARPNMGMAQADLSLSRRSNGVSSTHPREARLRRLGQRESAWPFAPAETASLALVGSGPIATALANRLPGTVTHVDDTALSATAFPSAAAWVVVISLADTAGERCWLRSAELMFAAARVANARDDADGGTGRAVYVVVGTSEDALGSMHEPHFATPREIEELRVTARGTVAPWACEDISRRLVGGCRGALGGSLDCRADEHFVRAIDVAASLAPDAVWICVPEVVAPFANGPWTSWARRPRGAEPDAAAATVDSLATAVFEAVFAVSDAGRPLASALAPSDDLRRAAVGTALAESTTPHDVCEPIPVVVPPRPTRPSQVAARQQACLWSGKVKHGNLWTTELTTRLVDMLAVGDDDQLLTAATGTAALRISFEAVVGRHGNGDVAVLPAFTFAATAEALLQMGYRLRLADADQDTWNLDPAALDDALSPGDVTLAVTVDALGAPCDHAALRAVAAKHGVPLVADSAAALGARHRGGPVAGWQSAHAYSLSFAKTMTAGGAGGVAVIPRRAENAFATNWLRSSMMTEIHAITALDQLDAMPDIVRRRQDLAEVYDAVLAGFPWATRQKARVGDQHSWVHYCVRLPDAAGRDLVADSLLRRGIQTKPYYAPALNNESWAHGFDSGHGPAEWRDLTVTTSLAQTVLAIPMSSELSVAQQTRVVEGLDSALAELERRS
jgi:dTDP-4-amino-4,6-dideoxygalactose transaminase